ncbi:MAG: LemA family protein [Candidatus Pacebacteria bacterium]|nr:LemA family protein [Candidatus Paceibacterota bacterium]
MITLNLFIGAVLLIGIILVIFYNSLVKRRVRTEEAWGDIDVQLKRRYDLIPNLVNAVKGYAKHEAETLQAVMEARSQATAINVDASDISPEQMMAMASAQTGISGALGKLLAVAEAYPDLKANQNFIELQRDLVDTEDKIQASRRFFNSTIQEYNTTVEVFPSNIIASMFKFGKKEFFELEENDKAKEAVEVKF